MPTSQPNLSKLGYNGVLGLAIETTAGTAVAPTTYIQATSINMDGHWKPVSRTPIRKNKSNAQMGPGIFEVSGGFQAEGSPATLGVLLGLSMGVDNVGALTGGAYPHVFTLGGPLNTATISEDLGGNTVHEWTGCKVDTLDISTKAGGSLLDFKYGFAGISDAPIAGSLSPTLPGPDQPYQFEQISSTISIGGKTLYADSFSIQLKNNLQPLYYAGSGSFAGVINEKQAMVTGSITTPYVDESIFQLLYGAALNAGPSASGIMAATNSLTCTFTHPTTGYTLIINCPNIFIESAPVAVTVNGVTMHSIKFTAQASTATSSDALKITLNNPSQSTSYVT